MLAETQNELGYGNDIECYPPDKRGIFLRVIALHQNHLLYESLVWFHTENMDILMKKFVLISTKSIFIVTSVLHARFRI